MTENKGWIKLHRKLLNWQWYDDIPTRLTFIHLLLTVAYTDYKYKGLLIKKGTRIYGQDQLATEVGITRAQLRRAICNLKRTSDITNVTSSYGSIVQIVKFKDYQSTTSDIANKEPTDNQRTTSIEESKEDKEVYRSFSHLSISVSEINKLGKQYSSEQIDNILDSIENYKKNTSYKSLFLTANKWLKKEYPKGKITESNPNTANPYKQLKK
tara:strand:+ start:197 stop:832 length:636 start_codon:yes stop_codon:yes gene_type:complete